MHFYCSILVYPRAIVSIQFAFHTIRAHFRVTFLKKFQMAENEPVAAFETANVTTSSEPCIPVSVREWMASQKSMESNELVEQSTTVVITSSDASPWTEHGLITSFGKSVLKLLIFTIFLYFCATCTLRNFM